MMICHSHYSIQDAFCHIDDLIERAVEYKLPYLILMDRNTLSGCVEFLHEIESSNKKKEHKIIGMIGCQVGTEYNGQFGYLNLLCKNKDGWFSLCRILSQLQSAKDYYFVPLELIKANLRGLILVTTSLSALDIPATELNIERFELEGREVFYIDETDYLYQQIVLCSKYQKTLAEFHEIVGMSNELQIFAENEWYLRNEYPQANLRLMELVESFSLKSKFMIPQLPGVTNPDARLLEICRQGWLERGINARTKDNPHLKDVYINRIKYELQVMAKAKLSMYWLVIHDIIQYAKLHNINCGLRGSAGGSLIAFLIGINHLDPIWPDYAYPYDPNKSLLFERFYSDARNIPATITLE